MKISAKSATMDPSTGFPQSVNLSTEIKPEIKGKW